MGDHRPRSSPVSPFEGYPAFGAVHDVVPNDRLEGFRYDFTRIANLMIARSQLMLPLEPLSQVDFMNPDLFADEFKIVKKECPDFFDNFDPRRFYRVFDPDTLGVSVVEMDHSQKAARAVRTVWKKSDFGAVEQEARNEADKNLGIEPLKLVLSGVMCVGRKLPNVRDEEVRQKVALMHDSNEHPEVIKRIEDEADVVTQAINRRLKQFMLPWDVFPHITFAVFRQRTSPEVIRAISKSAHNFIQTHPFEVRLGRLSFRHDSSR